MANRNNSEGFPIAVGFLPLEVDDVGALRRLRPRKLALDLHREQNLFVLRVVRLV
jgi:hypothetical protein